MMRRIKICRAEDVPAGEIRSFTVDGFRDSVLVTNIGGEFFATNQTCPHADVSLGRGWLNGHLIVCPGHQYSFDLRSGRCTHDPRISLVCYDVDIEGADVFVSLKVPVSL